MQAAQAIECAAKWVVLSAFAASLSVRSDADLQARRKELCALLPEIRAVSSRIIIQRQQNAGDA